MVDATGAIAGYAYSGYSYPAQSKEDMYVGQTDSTSSTSSLPAVYEPYDLNNDGVLSYSEYQAYLEAMGLISSSSSASLDIQETQTVSADSAKAAYQMNSGTGTQNAGIQDSTSVNIMV